MIKPETYPGITNSSTQSEVPATWPTYGIITFESVSLTYPDTGVKALRNLYCCFRAYEKVGSHMQDFYPSPGTIVICFCFAMF